MDDDDEGSQGNDEEWDAFFAEAAAQDQEPLVNGASRHNVSASAGFLSHH